MRTFEIRYLTDVCNCRSGKVEEKCICTLVELPESVYGLPDVEEAYTKARAYINDNYEVEIKEIIDIRPAWKRL